VSEEEAVVSPCNKICRLDESGTCIGCRRTIAEIIAWPTLSHQERIRVMERLIERIE
jgi:predicted Fe-S protein YdhL (DUF1289 family)